MCQEFLPSTTKGKIPRLTSCKAYVLSYSDSSCTSIEDVDYVKTKKFSFSFEVHSAVWTDTDAGAKYCLSDSLPDSVTDLYNNGTFDLYGNDWFFLSKEEDLDSIVWAVQTLEKYRKDLKKLVTNFGVDTELIITEEEVFTSKQDYFCSLSNALYRVSYVPSSEESSIIKGFVNMIVQRVGTDCRKLYLKLSLLDAKGDLFKISGGTSYEDSHFILSSSDIVDRELWEMYAKFILALMQLGYTYECIEINITKGNSYSFV